MTPRERSEAQGMERDPTQGVMVKCIPRTRQGPRPVGASFMTPRERFEAQGTVRDPTQGVMVKCIPRTRQGPRPVGASFMTPRGWSDGRAGRHSWRPDESAGFDG